MPGSNRISTPNQGNKGGQTAHPKGREGRRTAEAEDRQGVAYLSRKTMLNWTNRDI